MIKIFASQYMKSHELRIKGHANYKEKDDIVCSGVSALYYALCEALSRDVGSTVLEKEEHCGDTYIRFVGGKVSDGIYLTALSGFSLIASKYPGNVKIYK